MRRFADIKADNSLGSGQDKFRNATNHLHCACHASGATGRLCFKTLQQSGGRLPSQSFEFRNEMLECFEIADCRHRRDMQPIEHGDELRIANRLGQ